MRIRRIKENKKDNEKSVIIQFDEDGNFKEVESLEFAVYLTSDEHRSCIKTVNKYIVNALQENIEVYLGTTDVSRAKLCNSGEFVSSMDSIVLFATFDENKFEMVEAIVKDFASEISEYVALSK